jgi:hypothetical protein
VKKTLALLCGAAIAAAATVTLAQTPPGTDRPGGDTDSQSANPDMDKNKKGGMTKGTTGAGTGAPKTGGTPTPPGTDRPGGESGGQSANPNPDKK